MIMKNYHEPYKKNVVGILVHISKDTCAKTVKRKHWQKTTMKNQSLSHASCSRPKCTVVPYHI